MQNTAPTDYDIALFVDYFVLISNLKQGQRKMLQGGYSVHFPAISMRIHQMPLDSIYVIVKYGINY